MTVNYRQLLEGSKAFVENERRDAMYKVATYLVSKFWGKPRETADALGVLLLTWNQAFYRYGSFDFDALEKWLVEKMTVLQQLRERDVIGFNDTDASVVKALFDSLLESLQDPKGRKSPVAVSKTLHLLAPKFFPLWDNDISKAYGCYWYYSEAASDKYLEFMRKMRRLVEDVIQSFINAEGGNREIATKTVCERCSKNVPFIKSLLKVIDEYNYSRYSKNWLK